MMGKKCSDKKCNSQNKLNATYKAGMISDPLFYVLPIQGLIKFWRAVFVNVF